MTTAMMSETAPMLDHAGFEAIDLVGGAVFDVCVRYLREDPWERMRILSTWVKKTPLIVMTRGQSLFTFEFFPDDIVALTAERIFANGIRYHTPYDALNDMRNMEVPVRAGKKAGLYVDAGVVYTVSPVHTDHYYARKIKELVALGADAIFIKDPSGLLTPERAATLIPVAKSACGKLPLQLHSHCLTGLAPYVAVQAVEARCRCRPHCHLDARQWCFASVDRDSSSTISITQGFRDRSRPELVEQVAERLRYIATREKKPVGRHCRTRCVPL